MLLAATNNLSRGERARVNARVLSLLMRYRALDRSGGAALAKNASMARREPRIPVDKVPLNVPPGSAVTKTAVVTGFVTGNLPGAARVTLTVGLAGSPG